MSMSQDEREIRNIITECYEMISGPAGPRDWSRQNAIFHPDARQMRTGLDESGKPVIQIFDLDAYRSNADEKLSEIDFYEVELVNRIDIFGNMAQAWGSYEAKHNPDDAQPERRGINAFQLYKGTEGRWQIISMIWDNERDGLTLPDDMISPSSPR